MTNPVDLTAAVEGHDGIFVVRGGGNCRDWNNIQYQVGLSGKNVGARQLSMNVATIPPGGVAYAHIHVGFEVMLYILKGTSATSTVTDCVTSSKTRPATSSLSSRASPTKSST